MSVFYLIAENINGVMTMKDESEGCLSLLLLGLFALICWLTWPVCLWFGLAVLGTWTLFLIDGRLRKPDEDQALNFRARLVIETVGTMKETALCVSIGVGIVFICQLILSSASRFVNPQTVGTWEDRLSAINRTLTTYFGFRYLLITLAVLLMVSIVLPHLALVRRYLKLRQWSARCLLVMSTLTSFTFFAAADIHGCDAKWVAALKSKAQNALYSVNRIEKQIVAASWVENEIKILPKRIRTDLREIFRAANGQENTPKIIDMAAERVAKKAPQFQHQFKPQESKTKNSQTTHAFQSTFGKIRAWLRGEADTSGVTLNELRSFPKQVNDVEARLMETKAAAIESVSSLLEEALQIKLPTISRQFVAKLVNVLTETSLRAILPKNVTDLATARLWLQLNVRPSKPSKTYAAQQEWIWEVRSESISKSEPSPSAMKKTVSEISKEIKHAAPKGKDIWMLPPIKTMGPYEGYGRPKPYTYTRPRPRPRARR